MHATWCIYYVKDCPCTTPHKDKFISIVCADIAPMGFLINTLIHKFIQERPNLLACQVPIKQSEYGFLNHDSYINCTELFALDDNKLTVSKGKIKKQTISDIKAAVAGAKTIPAYYKKLII